MLRLARLAVSRPRRTIAIWAVVMGILAVIGIGVADRLHRANLAIPGTGSAEAAELAGERFGESNSLVVLLRGPRPALDNQGPRLVAALERDTRLAVLAPWESGAAETLRPDSRSALILIRADLPYEQVSREIVPAVRDQVDELTSQPVTPHVSGYADVGNGMQTAIIDAVKRAELISAPLLMIILLLVFRSPIAAALPLVIGITTIGAGSGLLELINRAVELDSMTLNLLSMMGLALGVDYALLIVSRFREQLAAGDDPRDAVLAAIATAGRTVLFAGIVLALAMVAALLTVPGGLLMSATFGVLLAVVLSLVGALTALPATLTILGPAVDRWRFGSTRDDDSTLGARAYGILRRPALAAIVVAGVIVAMGVPALALETGPPNARVLPESSRERVDFDQITETLGAGWTVPFEITVAAREGTVTTPARLRDLAAWQRQFARRDDVRAVLGPGEIAARTDRLEEIPGQLASAQDELERGLRDQRRLADGLARAGSGAEQLQAGLTEAAEGAGQLAEGGDAGAGGAALLATGLASALEGARTFDAGLAAARGGGDRLIDGAELGGTGAERLLGGLRKADTGLERALPEVERLGRGLVAGRNGIGRLREPAQIAERQLVEALAELNRMLPTSKLDPAYRRTYEAVATALGAISGRNPQTGEPVSPGYDGLDEALRGARKRLGRAVSGVAQLSHGLARLDSGLDRLETGAGRLVAGSDRLSDGIGELGSGLDRLEAGSDELLYGLERLAAGAGELSGGTDELAAGASELASGLAGGAERTTALVGGLERMREGVAGATIRTNRLANQFSGTDRLVETIDSGYFLLAALDSASEDAREASTFAVNLDRGGTAARITVIGRGEVLRAGHPLRGEIEDSLEQLEQKTNLETRLGGPAAVLQDFDVETSGSFWLLVLAISGSAYLVLVFVLRSVLLPLLAVFLNLLTVAAAFGVLALLFQGDPLLGGPGYVDAIMAAGIFSVVFGLSIDYEVFLLARMREGYERSGSTDGAIEYGLRHTAGVITGAALIMTGVFVAFALADVISMRQLGIGLTVAVLLDATLIRLVLMPAAIRLLGDASWWMPARLERLLPASRRAETEGA
jgi:RND superfamily putative drug exporter